MSSSAVKVSWPAVSHFRDSISHYRIHWTFRDTDGTEQSDWLEVAVVDKKLPRYSSEIIGLPAGTEIRISYLAVSDAGAGPRSGSVATKTKPLGS